MDRTTRPFLIGIAVAVVVLAAMSRIYRLIPVRFFRPFSSFLKEAANSPQGLTMTTQVLHLPYRKTAPGLFAQIRALARALAAEHTLALTAAGKAERSGRNLDELRALYVRPLDRIQ